MRTHRNAHVAFEQWQKGFRNLRVWIVGGGLYVGNVGCPMTDVGGNANHRAPVSPWHLWLQAFAYCILPRPVESRETLADHSNFWRGGCVTVTKISPAQHWNLHPAEISWPDCPKARNDR